MNLLEACTQSIVTAKRSTRVAEAARLMRDHHVGSVVVMGEEMPIRPVGVVTDRDLVIKALASGGERGSDLVEQYMSTKLVYAPGSMGIHEAIERMRKHGVRRLLVTGHGGDLRGIISFDDLLVIVAQELNAMTQLIATGMLHEEEARVEARLRQPHKAAKE